MKKPGQPMQGNLELTSRPNFHQSNGHPYGGSQAHMTATQSNPPPKQQQNLQVSYSHRDNH